MFDGNGLSWVSSVLTCGDIDVCDIHSAIQNLNRADAAQDVPEVVQSADVCNIQFHVHHVFNRRVQIWRKAGFAITALQESNLVPTFILLSTGWRVYFSQSKPTTRDRMDGTFIETTLDW